MNDALQSPAMTPIENVLMWKCRHCKHRWKITNPAAINDKDLRPKQCPNRKCRSADWDRAKIKPGRPRKPARHTKRRK